jgi:GWxTD domain-containing protein
LKKFLSSFLLFTISVFGQPRQDFPVQSSKLPFESEVISIPTITGDHSLYYVFKIPHKLLVFERENDIFNAAFRVIVEIEDEESNLVVRDIKDTKVHVQDFESTSDPNLFLQDYLSFKLEPKEYSIITTISDLNSEGELKLKPIKVDLKENDDKLLVHPFLVHAGKQICNDTEAFLLANTSGSVPFSNEIYHLVIPVKDTMVNEVEVLIENNDEEIFSGKIQEHYDIPIDITKCGNKLAVTSNKDNVVVRNFIVREVNKNLKEGSIALQVENDEYDIDEEYESKVVWLHKPISLNDPEKAIEFLSYIEPDSVVYSLLDADEDDYSRILNEYWSKFDPTPVSTFNEIMFEYYSRVDYAMKEFRGLNNGNGAKTDRGVVYIKFGKPEEIKRTSNPQGQVVEIWNYLKPERSFSFVDKKGTGNFTLIEE